MARERVRGELFGFRDTTTIGRFEVLRRIGAGGMGEVFSAYDPELDRRVAVKVVARDRAGSGGSARMLAEARAMARVSHPNVLPVFEVGRTDDDGVFIAMEFVAGNNLRQWSVQAERPWSEVLEVFIAAGEGLAAAHAAGLVHRDFKPDNVMVDDEGRVRVMDFGLSRAVGCRAPDPDGPGSEPTVDDLSGRLTEPGAIVGTLAYVAPEVLDGAEADPASDQFSFCVALHEALTGARPAYGDSRDELWSARVEREGTPRGLPAELLKVLGRGLARDPAERWASMDALVHQLRRLGAGRQRPGVVLVGASVAAVLVGVLWSAMGGGEACPDARAHLSGVWDDDRRQQVDASLRGTSVAYADDTADRVVAQLDRYADAWVAGRENACRDARIVGRDGEDLRKARVGCLHRRRRELGSLVDVLADADVDVVARALDATARLGDVERCASEEYVRAAVEPPADAEVAERVEALRDQLAGARARKAAGRFAPALAMVDATLGEAETVEYPPLTAEAQILRGTLLSETGDDEAGVTALRIGFREALAVGDDEQTLDAVLELSRITGIELGHHDEGRWWGEIGEALLAKAPELAPRRAALLAHLGMVAIRDARYDDGLSQLTRAHELLLAAEPPSQPAIARNLERIAGAYHYLGRHEESAAHYEQALKLQETLVAANHPSRARAMESLATAATNLGQFERAGALYEEALAILEEAYGLDHPHVANTLHQHGLLLLDQGRLDDAEPLLRRALAIRRDKLPEDHPRIAATLNAIGTVLRKRGDRAGAHALQLEALRITEARLGPDHPTVGALSINVGGGYVELKRYDAAEEMLTRGLEVVAEKLGPAHRNVGNARMMLGSLEMARERPREALAHYERALAVFEQSEQPGHPMIGGATMAVGEVLVALERYEEAVAALQRALEILDRGAAAAEISLLLADSLWHVGDDRPRAIRLGERARDTYAELGPPSADAHAKASRWLAEHPAGAG